MSITSKFADLLNALNEMQASPAYAVRRSVLTSAEQAIVSLEQELAAVYKAERAWESTMMQAIGEDGPGSVTEAIAAIKQQRDDLRHELDAMVFELGAMKQQRDELLAALKAMLDAFYEDPMSAQGAGQGAAADQAYEIIAKVEGRHV